MSLNVLILNFFFPHFMLMYNRIKITPGDTKSIIIKPVSDTVIIIFYLYVINVCVCICFRYLKNVCV